MPDLLEGWSYPVSETIGPLKILDHTFVVAPNKGPAYFDCFGGHDGAGRHSLDGASGEGNYAVANCYRMPSILPDTAGLIPYGVHGVCHQAANRFLWSACGWTNGPTVRNAQAYLLSFSFYGTYGRPINAPAPPAPWPPSPEPPWDFLAIYAKCKAFGDVQVGPEETLAVQKGFEQRIAALHQHIHAKRQEYDPNVVINEELRLLVEERLGAEFEFAKIQEIRNAALGQAYNVATSDLSGQTFAHEINAIAVRFLDDMENYLGAENYSRLMNMPPKVRYALVDPALAERARSAGTRAKGTAR
jgi:hypothetical protein